MVSLLHGPQPYDIPDSTNAYSFFDSLLCGHAKGRCSLCTPLRLVSSEALGNLFSQPIQGQKIVFLVTAWPLLAVG